jgi:hypothetical protein
VKAVTFAAPIPRYLVTAGAGRLNSGLYVGPHSCTRLAESPSPALPGPDWVRIQTRMGGICGSDLGIVTLSASPSTSPFSSFPFTPGHENVGTVAELGAAVKGWGVGERVVVNPLLSCVPRGIDPLCAGCADGHASRCEHFTDGHLAPGMLIGTTRGLGGGWGEEFVAHQSQLVAVPDAVADEEAVLIEPLACSVQAVRANLPPAGARVLVIGSGAIGLVTVAALQALSPGRGCDDRGALPLPGAAGRAAGRRPAPSAAAATTSRRWPRSPAPVCSSRSSASASRWAGSTRCTCAWAASAAWRTRSASPAPAAPSCCWGTAPC